MSELLLEVTEIPASDAVAAMRHGKILDTNDQETVMLATHYAILRMQPCFACGGRDCLTWPGDSLQLARHDGEVRFRCVCERCQMDTWQTSEGAWGQHFNFTFDDMGECWIWSIGRAMELTKGRETDRMAEPEEMLMALKVNESTPELDASYAMTTDLRKPLIGIQSPHPYKGQNRVIIIDGWHRMLKAVLLHVAMPVIVLTKEEAALCHVLTHPK